MASRIDPDLATAPAEGAAPGGTLPDDSLDRAAGNPSDPQAQPPTERLRVAVRERVASPGRYEMGPEIARGGIGRIVRARDTELDRAVAIKELVREDAMALARFRREIQITAALQHPNIVPLHDAGTWPNGQPFYAMKLVAGRTLGAILRDAPSFEARLALLPVLTDVAEALAYAHSQGVVHRDLKPGNVLVGPFGETVVIDWGLAKHVDDEPEPSQRAEVATVKSVPDATRAGVVVGTPAYMPPEQARGDDVDFRADVYAIGAMLYHLVSGKGPYAGHDEQRVLALVKETEPTPLARLVPEAPRDLVAIAEKAMARKTEDRYPTARELSEELRRYASGGLVGAYRYGALDLGKRFFERHRGLVLTALVALAALAFLGAASVRRVTEERDRARLSAASEGRARADAELKVDELLVEKARALLDRDPTASVAWLKKPRTTPPGAATIASWAEERGVAHRVLRGHQGPLTSVAYSPDGRQMATGGDDKRAVLWDEQTGRAVELPGHTDRVSQIAFSPDGQVVASASYDQTTRLYTSAGTLLRVLSGPKAPVKSIAFSSSGASLCSVSTDGDVREWNAGSGTSTSRLLGVDRDPFCGFSPDGAFILSGSHHGSLRLWNPSTGEARLLSGHKGASHGASFSPDGRVIASGGEDGTLRLYPVSSGPSKVLFDGDGPIHRVVFSPDGRKLAAAGMSGRVRLVELSGGNAQVVAEHGERVASLAFSRDGRYLASSGWDRIVRVADLSTRATTTLRGHGDVVVGLAFSPDGSRLASASWDKTVRVWTAHRNERRVLRGHAIGVRTVAFSPDGHWVASGGHDDAVRLWDTRTGSSRVLSGHTDHVYRVLFSPDGKHLASSSDDRTVRIWSVAGDAVATLSGHQDDVEELAFSPDGSHIVSASEDGTARLWTLSGGMPVVLEHEHDVTAVAFDKSGAVLATASRDKTVRLWDGRTGAPRRVLRGHADEVWGLAFSADGARLASASSDDTVIVWSAAGERQLQLSSLPGASRIAFSPEGTHLAVGGVAPHLWLCSLAQSQCHELRGHTAMVHDLAFLPDGQTLATVGGDATVAIWDLPSHERRVLEGHAAPVFGLSVSPDGKWLASGSGDATVRLWPVSRPPAPSALRGFLDGLSHEELGPGIDSAALSE